MTSKLVRDRLASYLHLAPEVIREDQRLDEDLGLDSLDLVLLTLDLDRHEPWPGDFPYADLERPDTVGELAALYRACWSAPATDEEIPPTLRAAG